MGLMGEVMIKVSSEYQCQEQRKKQTKMVCCGLNLKCPSKAHVLGIWLLGLLESDWTLTSLT
jgi:hypothetical protein